MKAELFGGPADGHKLEITTEIDIIRTSLKMTKNTNKIYSGFIDELEPGQHNYIYTGIRDGVRIYVFQKLLER